MVYENDLNFYADIAGWFDGTRINISEKFANSNFVNHHEQIHSNIFLKTPDGSIARYLGHIVKKHSEILLLTSDRSFAHHFDHIVKKASKRNKSIQILTDILEGCFKSSRIAHEAAATYLGVQVLASENERIQTIESLPKEYKDYYSIYQNHFDNAVRSSCLRYDLARSFTNFVFSSPACIALANSNFSENPYKNCRFKPDNRLDFFLKWIDGHIREMVIALVESILNNKQLRDCENFKELNNNDFFDIIDNDDFFEKRTDFSDYIEEHIMVGFYSLLIKRANNEFKFSRVNNNFTETSYLSICSNSEEYKAYNRIHIPNLLKGYDLGIEQPINEQPRAKITDKGNLALESIMTMEKLDSVIKFKPIFENLQMMPDLQLALRHIIYLLDKYENIKINLAIQVIDDSTRNLFQSFIVEIRSVSKNFSGGSDYTLRSQFNMHEKYLFNFILFITATKCKNNKSILLGRCVVYSNVGVAVNLVEFFSNPEKYNLPKFPIEIPKYSIVTYDSKNMNALLGHSSSKKPKFKYCGFKKMQLEESEPVNILVVLEDKSVYCKAFSENMFMLLYDFFERHVYNERIHRLSDHKDSEEIMNAATEGWMLVRAYFSES